MPNWSDRRSVVTGDCDDCAEYWQTHPYLTAACASVGIEHGKDTTQMLREYFAGFHQRGHQPGGITPDQDLAWREMVALGEEIGDEPVIQLDERDKVRSKLEPGEYILTREELERSER